MGLVLMSKRELNWIDVLARLDGGRLTTAAAADLMRLTLRQTHRLLKRYRDGGAASIATGGGAGHRTTGCLMVRDHAIALVREYYADLVRRWLPRSWANAMMYGCRERRCAAGCGRPGSGLRGRSANASSSRAIVVNMLAS
jgi:hypothetical protein